MIRLSRDGSFNPLLKVNDDYQHHNTLIILKNKSPVRQESSFSGRTGIVNCLSLFPVRHVEHAWAGKECPVEGAVADVDHIA